MTPTQTPDELKPCPMCGSADSTKACVWCISSGEPEPTIEEVMQCMEGEFVDG